MKINDEQKETIKALYERGLSADSVAKQVLVHRCTIYKVLKELDIPRRSNKVNSIKYQCNYDYFETIDSEDKAYWLGFIAADGYVSKVKHCTKMGISLGIVDIGHLCKFKEAIKAEHPIKEYLVTGGYKVGTKYCRINISGDKIFNDLVNHGVIEHKSLTIEFPKNIREDLVRHYVRGYFDGNGSFMKSYNFLSIGICSTKEFLESLQEIFGVQRLKLGKRHNNGTNNYSLDITKRSDVISIAKYMYDNATVYLDRKYDLSQEIINETYVRAEVTA